MNLLEIVKENFAASIQTKKRTADLLSEKIVIAAKVMKDCLESGNKILACGNGGSASDAEHFAGEMINHFLIPRRELPVLALTGITPVVTSIANDCGYAEIFAKQIKAFGQVGDVLLVISTSGNSSNILRAVAVAQEKQIKTIALLGQDGGKLRSLLGEQDLEICVPGNVIPRIQETHLLVMHCLCDLIEQLLVAPPRG